MIGSSSKLSLKPVSLERAEEISHLDDRESMLLRNTRDENEKFTQALEKVLQSSAPPNYNSSSAVPG